MPWPTCSRTSSSRRRQRASTPDGSQS
jgi:hypothetical protein